MTRPPAAESGTPAPGEVGLLDRFADALADRDVGCGEWCNRHRSVCNSIRAQAVHALASLLSASPASETRPACAQCGPGYRIGDEGCRHTDHASETPTWSCITDHVTFPGCGTCGPCRQALAAGWAVSETPDRAALGRDIAEALRPMTVAAASETPGPHEHRFSLGLCMEQGCAVRETPGPGEGDLRGEVERLRREDEAWQEGYMRLNDSYLRVEAERDAAVEQRTLAVQKVARVEALHLPCGQAEGCNDKDDGFCHACGTSWPCPTRAALADPEAER